MKIRNLINEFQSLFQNKPRFKTHSLEGNVCALDLIQVQSAWFEDPEFDERIPVLWDLTRASITWDEKEASVITKGLAFRAEQYRPSGKICILAANQQDLDILTLAITPYMRVERVKLTVSESEARQWLLSKSSPSRGI